MPFHAFWRSFSRRWAGIPDIVALVRCLCLFLPCLPTGDQFIHGQAAQEVVAFGGVVAAAAGKLLEETDGTIRPQFLLEGIETTDPKFQKRCQFRLHADFGLEPGGLWIWSLRNESQSVSKLWPEQEFR